MAYFFPYINIMEGGREAVLLPAAATAGGSGSPGAYTIRRLAPCRLHGCPSPCSSMLCPLRLWVSLANRHLC